MHTFDSICAAAEQRAVSLCEALQCEALNPPRMLSSSEPHE